MPNDHDPQVNNTSSEIKLFGAKITLQDQIQPPQPNTNHNDQQPTSKTDELTEKRPDKIIPCPRCKSMDTKFCYFNNYNVNQPRHFCKGCQRYWTAGGALRNVPVGAGRRKTKPSCSGLPELSKGGFFDDASVHDLDVEGWEAAEHGGIIRHIFPAKRRRCASNSQSY